MKERNRNKTHQQNFQGRHDQPPPPPLEPEKQGAPFGPDLDASRPGPAAPPAHVIQGLTPVQPANARKEEENPS